MVLAAMRRPLVEAFDLYEVETVAAPIHCTTEDLPEVMGAMRPRATVMMGHAHVYNSPRHTKALEAIRERWTTARGSSHAGFTGPVAVSVLAHRAMPASWPKRRMGDPDTAVPDADNIGKLVMDALAGVAYADDAQVVLLVAAKAPRFGGRDWYEVEVTYLAKRTLL